MPLVARETTHTTVLFRRVCWSVVVVNVISDLSFELHLQRAERSLGLWGTTDCVDEGGNAGVVPKSTAAFEYTGLLENSGGVRTVVLRLGDQSQRSTGSGCH
jgi:hypothetical protein